jgi:hypothetical protein
MDSIFNDPVFKRAEERQATHVEPVLPDVAVFKVVNVAPRGAPPQFLKEYWRERVGGVWSYIEPPVRLPTNCYGRRK